MPRSFEEILTGFASLKAEDFNESVPEADGIQKLCALTDELFLCPEPERGIGAMLDVMERLPEAYLGSPGPLVHALERMRGRYESALAESVKRKATRSTIWMVNRILNGTRDSEQRKFYVDLLRFVAEQPGAADTVRQDAQRFIQHQAKAA